MSEREHGDGWFGKSTPWSCVIIFLSLSSPVLFPSLPPFFSLLSGQGHNLYAQSSLSPWLCKKDELSP